MPSILKGKTAIITGASSGIGRATALQMAREGMNLVLASRNGKALEAVSREVETMGSRAFACPTDITSEVQVASLVDETVRRFGRIDVIVCNAGQLLRREAARLRMPEIRQIMDVNFFGTLNLVYAVLPTMLERRSGHVVVVSSIDGKKGLPCDTAYVASKFALNGFMDVLRQELRGSGVHACTILPGRVDTPMIGNLQVPFGSRKITVDRVARAIVRGIKRNHAEVIVPYLGPKFLVVASSFSARFGDWLVRLFKLEGVEEGGGMSHNEVPV